MADEEKIILDVDTKNANKSIKDLRDEVKKYKDELVTLDSGSKEYNRTLLALAESQGQINKINQDIRSSTMNLTSIYSSLTTVMQGVVGGFASVTAASALFGDESNQLVETLVKLQAGMALIQSLRSLSYGIKAVQVSFKALNATLVANPFLAIAAAVAALVAGLSALGNSLTKTQKHIDDLNKSQESLNRSLQIQNDELALEIELLKLRDGVEDEVFQRTSALLRQEIDLRQQNIDKLRLQLAEAEIGNEVTRGGLKKLVKALKESLDEAEKDLDESYERQKKLNRNNLLRQESDRIASEKRTAQEIEKLRKQELAEQEKYQNTIYNIDKENEKRRGDLLKESDRLIFVQNQIIELEKYSTAQKRVADNENLSYKERNIALSNYQKTLNELSSYRKEEITLIEQIQTAETTRLENLAELEKRLEEIRNPEQLSYAEQVERFNEQINQYWIIAENEALSYEERIEAVEQYIDAQNRLMALQQKQEAEDKKLKAEQLKRERELSKLKIQIANQTFQAGVDILGQETAAGKALAIAGATISTYQAGANALRDIPYPLNIAALFSTVAAGVAQVKKIVDVSVPGASNSGSVAISLPTMPELLTPIQETHNNFDAYDEDFFNSRPEQRVILVDSDAFGSSKEVQKRDSETYF